jgi:hypothetical protein
MEFKLSDIFNIYSIWFFVFQAVVWFGICGAIIISVAAKNSRNYDTGRSLKQNVGLFLLFVFLSTALIYIMFGPTSGAQKLAFLL